MNGSRLFTDDSSASVNGRNAPPKPEEPPDWFVGLLCLIGCSGALLGVGIVLMAMLGMLIVMVRWVWWLIGGAV